MEIVDFLRARYDEAQKAEEGKRQVIPSPFDDHQTELVYDGGETRLLVDGHPYPIEKYQEIATEPAPDPFTLADIESKRQVIRFYEEAVGFIAVMKEHGREASHYQVAAESYLNVLRAFARVYREHPDFDQLGG